MGVSLHRATAGIPPRNPAHPPAQMKLWVGVSFGVLAAWILAWILGGPRWLDWLLLLLWFASIFWLFFANLSGPERRR